jgi:predicted nucleotidyltransferase
MAVLDSVTQGRARAAVRALARQARVRAAFVFGSQAEGRADQWSDLDVAVFVEGLEAWDRQQRVRARAMVQQEVGDDIEIHLLRAEHLAAPLPASLAGHVLKHGVPIDLD